MQLVNIGFGNIIAANKIVAIVSPESAPIKRMVQEAKDAKTAIDATCGRRTRAVLIMDSGHVILSAVQPETISARLDKNIAKAYFENIEGRTIPARKVLPKVDITLRKFVLDGGFDVE